MSEGESVPACNPAGVQRGAATGGVKRGGGFGGSRGAASPAPSEASLPAKKMRVRNAVRTLHTQSVLLLVMLLTGMFQTSEVHVSSAR